MLKYIVYIKDHTDSTVLTQIMNPKDLQIDEKLNDFGSASFFLPFSSPYATPTIIRQLNRVDIYEQNGAIETKVFEGIIRGYEANFEGVTVNIADFLYLLSLRILFSSGYTASSEAVNTTLTTILGTLNATNDTGLTIDPTDLLTTVVNKQFERGDDFTSIVKDLAIATNAEFKVKDRMLQFKTTIGTDRTNVGTPEFREFKFDILNPTSNTINRGDVTIDLKDFANAVLGKSGANYSEKTDGTSITSYGRIETAESFSDSDATGLPIQTQNFLDLSKDTQQFPNVEPSTKNMLYQSVDVGDVVKIFINSGSQLFAFDGNYKIVKKTLRRTDLAVPRIDLEFSENAISDEDLTDLFNKMEKRIQKLELNQ